MKIFSKTVLSMIFALLITLSFTSYLQSAPFRSMSIGGATGLISTPTAHTGWEGNSIGLDLGYHYLKDSGGAYGSTKGNYSVPKVLVHLGIAGTSLELGGTYDIQPEVPNVDKTDDLLFNVKWAFTKGLAIGGNYQRLELNNTNDRAADKQIYLAATYPGTFFLDMNAEVTMVIGHTFYGNKNKRGGIADDQSKNLDFSMGFDLDLLPRQLKGYVHWINDFSNYSYSSEAGGANAWHRGCFNTGIRIAALRDKRYKLNFDLILTDALDKNREWAIGGTFGLSL